MKCLIAKDCSGIPNISKYYMLCKFRLKTALIGQFGYGRSQQIICLSYIRVSTPQPRPSCSKAN